MRKDVDRRHFIDYVSWDSVVAVAGMDDDDYSDYLRAVSSILQRGLDHPHAGVLEKYLWIHKQYVSAIRQFEKIPPEHDYRTNNPENYDAVVGLPKLNAEAKRAKSIVAQAEKAKRGPQT